MPVPTDLTRYAPPFLKNRLKRYAPCFILRLTMDILVDRIFILLNVEDVICLRRVDKTFFLLTHEPVIWKRFLARMSIPIPPLRPSLRWTLDSTNFQIEQLVVKAICADDNWRRASPKFGHTKVIFAFYEVLEMKLLPGGQYLVASVKDAGNRFFICIFCLDHPEENFPPLARLPVPTKAFNLEARFMSLNDQQGIMIMYSHRQPEDGRLRGYNPAEWSARSDIDSPYALRYECLCTFVDIQALEMLADPFVSRTSHEFRRRAQALPNPFQFVIHFVSDSPVEHPSLFDCNDKPFGAVVQKPDEIVIMDLSSTKLTSIKCKRIDHFADVQHTIRAVRVLPEQNHVLIVRTLKLSDFPGEEYDSHSIELHELPGAGDLGAESTVIGEVMYINSRNASSVHISDNHVPPKGADHPSLHDSNAPPPPISIFLSCDKPAGLHHINVYPHQVENGRWLYGLTWCYPQTTTHNEENAIRVVPGVRRALVYTVPRDDRTACPKLVALRRYFNPHYYVEKDYPYDFPSDVDTVVRRRYRRPANHYSTLSFNSQSFQHIAEKGFSALTWDESTGRVCIASQKNMKILIMDVKKTVPPDDRFAQWRRTQSLMNNA